MAWTTRGLALAAAAGGGAAVLVRRARKSRLRAAWPTPGGGDDRWHVITVALPIDKVTPDGRPPDFGPDVEVQVRPAPGDKGTEVAARGGDPREVRRALRETKSVLETGEVLRPDGPPTTKRTLLSRPLEYATRHGREEGRL